MEEKQCGHPRVVELALTGHAKHLVLLSRRCLHLDCTVWEFEIVRSGIGPCPSVYGCIWTDCLDQLVTNQPEFRVQAALTLAAEPLGREGREKPLPPSEARNPGRRR